MKQQILVIHEVDHDDDAHSVVGVADSVENAQKVIDEYYGEYKEISFKDIRDSSIEWEKTLELEGAFKKPYRVTVWLEWYTLNEA